MSGAGPLWIAIGLLWVSVAGLLVVSLQRTDGHLVYALDDPYIHMAMARTLALCAVGLIDRLTYHAAILKTTGSSDRLREAEQSHKRRRAS